MNNEVEQKKEYIKPEVTVLEYTHQGCLLSCSDGAVDDGCGEAVFND